MLLRVPAEELVEMAAISGFDFVFIDCEHGPADLVEVRRHIALASLHGVPSLVRVGSDEPGLILRVLDAGRAGVIAPHIDTAAGAGRWSSRRTIRRWATVVSPPTAGPAGSGR